MTISAQEISEVIKERLKDFDAQVVEANVGRVISVGDGIAQIYGLRGAMAGELLEFPNDVFGMALNLEEDQVRAVILGEFEHIREGDEVRTTGRIVEVPVGPELVGRMVDPLGNPLDGKGPIETQQRSPVERIAPGVITRSPVNKPVQTGIKAIDAMIPIGRGQRELVIGDRQIGKTAILVDTILNQQGKELICIYVAIGQNATNIARLQAQLEEQGAMEYTIIVAASAAQPASLQFIAPYSGCAMGEWFRDNGQDALIVYDDLTKHAWAYRELSLSLRRPPGREAYPGDVFYLHSRLLERAAKMNDDHGGGSLTALPVIETQANDVSAYIPTNVISITDGQIYLEADLFNSGVRPAISVGLSVSRVGGAAQTRAMRKVSGQMKLDLAQYRDVAAFAQFASDLDKATRDQLERGQRLTELLKQDQYSPVPLGLEVAVVFAGTRRFLDGVPVNRVSEWEQGFSRYMQGEHKGVLDAIEEKKDLDDATAKQLEEAIRAFNRQFGVEEQPQQQQQQAQGQQPQQEGQSGQPQQEGQSGQPQQEGQQQPAQQQAPIPQRGQQPPAGQEQPQPQTQDQSQQDGQPAEGGGQDREQPSGGEQVGQAAAASDGAQPQAQAGGTPAEAAATGSNDQQRGAAAKPEAGAAEQSTQGKQG